MVQHKLLIADDHPLFRAALEQAISSALPNIDCQQADSLEKLIEQLQANQDVDLVLLDLKMPGVLGFSGLMFLRAQFPNIPVVVVSASEEPNVVRRVMALGASGFIPKSASMETMQQAVAAVLAGEVCMPEEIESGAQGNDEDIELTQRMRTLTPQQMRVLMLLRDGLLNKQIAYKLDVSEATIKAHVSAILQKLNVGSRTQAVIAAGKIDQVIES